MYYNIKISSVKDLNSNARAYATVVFENSLAVKNIAIVEKKNGDGVFVSMPSLKTKETDEMGNPVFKDICNPITADFQKEFTGAILKAYELKKEDKLEKDGLDVGTKTDEFKYRLSVTPFEKKDGNIRGLASVYLEDSFVISGITIINGKNGVFVSMPAYKANVPGKDGENVYRDIAYPITKEFRAEISKAILDEYHNKRNRQLEEKLGVDKYVQEEIDKEINFEKKEEKATEKSAEKKTKKSKEDTKQKR